MKVYVAYLDYGYEGRSKPLGVFSTEEKAWAYIGKLSSYTRAEVDEHEIDEPPKDQVDGQAG